MKTRPWSSQCDFYWKAAKYESCLFPVHFHGFISCDQLSFPDGALCNINPQSQASEYQGHFISRNKQFSPSLSLSLRRFFCVYVFQTLNLSFGDGGWSGHSTSGLLFLMRQANYSAWHVPPDFSHVQLKICIQFCNTPKRYCLNGVTSHLSG